MCRPPAPQTCSAGDSAAYERRNTADDDVVIVASLRTPLTKVRAASAAACPLAVALNSTRVTLAVATLRCHVDSHHRDGVLWPPSWTN